MRLVACGTSLLMVVYLGAGLMAEETSERLAELRDLGRLQVQARTYGDPTDRSSWITIQAADARTAARCASKYVEDILGYGDVLAAPDPGLPGTHLALAGTGEWVLGLDAERFHIVFARTPAGLASLLARAGAARWQAVGRELHPRWMDIFDNAAMTFWFSGFGILPKDIPADHAWYARNGFTACAVLGSTERRLIAPGIIDTSVMDWQTAVSAANRIPYKVMADMATPARPESLWNYLPLPYYQPADGQVASAAQLWYQALGVHAAFQAGAATDRLLMDFRRRVAGHLAKDPNFIGHHVMQEMPGGDPRDLLCLTAVAGTPAIQESWRSFLRDVRKLDLAAVGSRLRGDAAAFRSWSEVRIPALRDLLGWNESCIDLGGMWEGRADRDAKADQAWLAAADGWSPVDCQDLGIMLYGQGKGCDYYLRRTFTVSPAQASARFLHLARIGDFPREFDVRINGRKLEVVSRVDPSCPDWDLCLDAGPALRPGANTIVINTRGVPIAAYLFLGSEGRWTYPGPSATRNAAFFDMTAFEEWLVMRELEDRMIAIRAGDPDRPMKIMAPHNYIDRTLDLCARYGAYPHDTGGAGAWWGPFTYSRYAVTRGIPNSAEEGGVPGNAADLQANLTRYLMMGCDTVDNVGHCSAYTGDPGKDAWITENRELLRCFGKQDLVQPAVGVLRCGRELRLGISDMYAWDLGRGPLPSVGRAFTYAGIGDLQSGRADRFKVLLDCATTVMSSDEVDLVERYVRQGGTFVAFHNTGMHTPEQAFAWPISRLTGLRVRNDNRQIGPSDIVFSPTQGLWPKLRGQKLPGWGMVLDWRNEDRTGTPVAMQAEAADIEVVATWAGRTDGNIAVAIRKLGKGRVITLGSTFYRKGKDESGRYVEPGTLPYLDELLASLGVPRETIAGTLWSEHWRSKNGIYDIYPVAQMDPKAQPGTTDVRLARDTPVAALRELSAPQHPSRPVQYADGMLTIPQVEMSAMQTRVFAAPRPDPELGALYWLDVQQRQSGRLPDLPAADRQRAICEPAGDVLALADGWRMATGDRDTGWTAPADASTVAWKPVRLGSFAAMGLPEESLVQLRREVELPEAWAGQRISLGFDTENWFWGITWRARLWINGQPAATAQQLQPAPNGCFTLDLTPAQVAERKLVIALEVDGRLPDGKPRAKPRPSGVTGTFFLRASPQPLEVTPLGNWSSATDLSVLTPVEVGSEVRCQYLETRFRLPASWPGRRLRLRAQVGLGSLFINNRYLSTPPAMQELDISGLVKPGDENVLRWVPGKVARDVNDLYKGKVPALDLIWLP